MSAVAGVALPFVLVGLLLLRQNIVVLLGVATFSAYYFWGDGELMNVVYDMWDASNRELLLSVPLYVLAGAIMSQGASAARLVLLAPLGLWLEAAPVADILVLPAEDLPAVLWADPDSPPARRWAALPENDEENVAAQVESIQRRAAMAKFVWPIPDKGLRKRLHRIAAPTLILWGEHDRTVSAAYGAAWRRAIPGAVLSVIPGGHMVLHEAPVPTAARVAAFLGATPGAGS